MARYQTLAEVESQVLKNARNALASAQRRGLRGAQGGRFADAQFNRLNAAFNQRLSQEKSPYRLQIQPARNIMGQVVPARQNGRYTAGSLRLDVILVDSQGNVLQGYDMTLSRSKWNSQKINQDYVRRFGIQEGYVREINPKGLR
ncbi:hypothetical protein HYR99_35730 [Candidatus Poribacteria bacterium]|nr:hypothetical protein [Candidatus Poribacteria bacterium]